MAAACARQQDLSPRAEPRASSPPRRCRDRSGVCLTIAAGFDDTGPTSIDTDLMIDLGAARAASPPPEPADEGSPREVSRYKETTPPTLLRRKIAAGIGPGDGVGRTVYPVSGGASETVEDTLRLIIWRPCSGAVDLGVASADLEWLQQRLAESDLPTVICTPASGTAASGASLARLAAAVASHGHVVAWLSGHAAPTACSLRAGIAIILFDLSAGSGILGRLEIGERLSLDLTKANAASIDMPLCPPTDRWNAALPPGLA